MIKIDTSLFPKLNLKHPAIWLATWFGSGFISPAPGTWGSAASLPFIILIGALAGMNALIVFTATVTIIGFWACHIFEKQSNIHDCKHVVIDETAGLSITLLPIFILTTTTSPILIALGFIAFRIFDILKPWPVSHFDTKIEGPIGVMGDDIIAGIFAAGIVTGAIYVQL